MEKKKQKQPVKNKYKRTVYKQPLISLKEGIIYAVILSVITFVLFQRAVNYDLITFDDTHILGQFNGAHLVQADIKEAFNKPILSYYRPILSASIIMDQADGAQIYSNYHRTNIILHIVVVLLFFLTLLRLFKDKRIAFFGALIFAVHPMLVPASVWIFGRNDTLLAIFFLPAFNFFISYLQTERKESKVFYFILHILFITACFFTKENSAIIPIILVAYSYIILKEKLVDKKMIYCYVCWILAGVLFLYKRHIALAHIEGAEGAFRGWEALSHNYPAVFVILGKIFFPFNMILNGNFEFISICSGVIACIAIAALFFIPKTDKRMFIFCLIWFFIFIIPTLFTLMTGSFDYLEHRAYIPIMAILFIIISLLQTFNINTSSPWFTGICSAISITFAVRSYFYMEKFESTETFWTHYVEKRNTPEAYMIVAQNMDRDKFIDFSEEILAKGNEKFPNDRQIKNGYASHFSNIEQHEKAIAIAKTVVEENPTDITALNILSGSYAKIGMIDSTKVYAEKSLAIDSTQIPVINNLGYYYYNKKDYNQARDIYLKATLLSPKHRDSWYNLASSYYCLSDTKNALLCFEKVLEIQNMKDKDALLYSIYLSIDSDPRKAAQYAKTYKELGGVLNPQTEAKLPKSGNNPFFN